VPRFKGSKRESARGNLTPTISSFGGGNGGVATAPPREPEGQLRRLFGCHSTPLQAQFTPQIQQCVPYSLFFGQILLNNTMTI
jgi:hypothetical protein